MEDLHNKNEKYLCIIKTKMVFLIAGILIGFFGVVAWQYILPKHLVLNTKDSGILYQEVDFKKVKTETNERLIKYIEGKWRSSVGDLIIWVKNAEEEGELSAMELEITSKSLKKESKYKIVEFTEVDGFFGILKINICEIGLVCSNENLIPIQINRVFDVDKTIVISYPSILTGCIEDDADGTCSRSFKLMH